MRALPAFAPILFACGPSVVGPTTPQPMLPSHAETPATQCPTGQRSLSGQLVDENERPVHSFAIVATKDFAFTGLYRRPQPVTTSDGRFHVCVEGSDEADVLIVGLGFARITIPGIKFSDSETSLGKIVARHGIVVEGDVLDETGKPVPDATVRIEQSVWDTEQFANLAAGNLETRTDETGRFTFAEYRPLTLGAAHPRIYAMTAMGSVSPVARIQNARDPLHLVVGASSALALTISGTQEEDAVMLLSPNGRTTLARVRNALATFEGIVPGKYQVAVLARGHERDGFVVVGTVEVVAGQATAATLQYGPRRPTSP